MSTDRVSEQEHVTAFLTVAALVDHSADGRHANAVLARHASDMKSGLDAALAENASLRALVRACPPRPCNDHWTRYHLSSGGCFSLSHEQAVLLAAVLADSPRVDDDGGV